MQNIFGIGDVNVELLVDEYNIDYYLTEILKTENSKKIALLDNTESTIKFKLMDLTQKGQLHYLHSIYNLDVCCHIANFQLIGNEHSLTLIQFYFDIEFMTIVDIKEAKQQLTTMQQLSALTVGSNEDFKKF